MTLIGIVTVVVFFIRGLFCFNWELCTVDVIHLEVISLLSTLWLGRYNNRDSDEHFREIELCRM